MKRTPRSLRASLALLCTAALAVPLACIGCRGPSARHDARSSGPATTALAVASAPSVSRLATVRALSPGVAGSVAIAAIDERRVALVADDDEEALEVVDLDAQKLLSTTPLGGAPGQLLLGRDGTLYVALRDAAAVVAFRFRADGTAHEVARQPTPDEPYGLALTPDQSTLLVTTGAPSGVEGLRSSDLRSLFRTDLRRDPRSIAVTADGSRAFVTHAVGSDLSVVELAVDRRGRAREVSLDARERRRDFGQTRIMKPRMPTKTSPSMDGSFLSPCAPEVRISMRRSATQGFGLAMIGERVLLPETLVMTSDNLDPEPPSGYGSVAQSTLSTHVPFVARVSSGIETETLDTAELSGPADRQCFERKSECLVPRAVTSDGAKLFVACLDSDEVLVIDPSQDAEHAPACRRTLRQRRRLDVALPTGLAVDAERHSAVVFSSFTRKLTVVTLADEPPPAAPAGSGTHALANRAVAQGVNGLKLDVGDGSVSKTPPTSELVLPRSAELPSLVTEGRRLFHHSAEPRIAANGRACASCHVEGRDDALVWPTPSGVRQTPMLAGRIEGTAPYGWNGEHATLAEHIKRTVKNLEGTGLSEHELDALAAYVASMKAPRRHAKDEVTRGQAIFQSSEAACSSCHDPATRFTDLGTHLLPASAARRKGGVGFDTPSLAFVGQTAPYFHDGRFATLEALVDACDRPDTHMGSTKHLAPDDRKALVSYLESL